MERCDRCGICLDSCPVSRSGGDSILSELNAKTGTGAWNCVNCWTCMEVCPLDVDIYHVMMKRRRDEEMPELIRHVIDKITGSGLSIDFRNINDIRETYGLAPLRVIDREALKILLDEET